MTPEQYAESELASMQHFFLFALRGVIAISKEDPSVIQVDHNVILTQPAEEELGALTRPFLDKAMGMGAAQLVEKFKIDPEQIRDMHIVNFMYLGTMTQAAFEDAPEDDAEDDTTQEGN